MALSRKPTNMVAEHCFAEQVELHDEMAEYMQRVSEQPAELSVEEHKEQTKGTEQQATYSTEHVVKLEAELQKSVMVSSRRWTRTSSHREARGIRRCSTTR